MLPTSGKSCTVPHCVFTGYSTAFVSGCRTCFEWICSARDWLTAHKVILAFGSKPAVSSQIQVRCILPVLLIDQGLLMLVTKRWMVQNVVTRGLCCMCYCCRSYEAPKRDEEKEIERKAKARKARSTRRSTQVCHSCQIQLGLEQNMQFWFMLLGVSFCRECGEELVSFSHI